MKLILAVIILAFSHVAYSLSQASATVGQFAGPGQSYQPTSDGNIPCNCNGDGSPIQAQNQWTSLAPEASAGKLNQGTSGTDENP